MCKDSDKRVTIYRFLFMLSGPLLRVFLHIKNNNELARLFFCSKFYFRAHSHYPIAVKLAANIAEGMFVYLKPLFQPMDFISLGGLDCS